MHPVLMTIVALGINSGDGPVQSPKAPTPYVQDCASCGPGGCAQASHRDIKKALHAQHNMMPQSCYEPTFGCYSGSRFMHRYPAFHGTYYRRPYNYRNLFDYPWHAELHEPTSQFSYNVVGPTAQPQPQSVEEVEPAESTTLRRPSAGESIQLQPIGTGVKTRNPFRSASVSRHVESDSANRATTSTRRTHRRGSIDTPSLRR